MCGAEGALCLQSFCGYWYSPPSMAQIQPRFLWPALTVGATLPRLLAAFFLPNAFGDAYVYIRDIGVWSTRMSSGNLHLTDLFGFWLPLYQLISAVLNVVIKNGFYSGKIVSALFGAGVCLFVYAVTLRLTQNRRAALLMFLLVALNPLHIFYSASAMTDVPHAFFITGALHFVLDRRWTIAAVFGALAGLTRVEGWMLIALIPLVQFIWERKVSIVGIIIQLTAPLFWFYISWKATGNWLACFEQRNQYRDWLLTQNPDIARFSAINVLRDTGAVLVSAEAAVLMACVLATWLLLKNPKTLWRRAEESQRPQVIAPLLFFLAFLGLLMVAYLTHQQPIIFPRYGLILFNLGLPVLAWVYWWASNEKPRLARQLFTTAAILLALDTSIQLALTAGTLRQIAVQRSVADYLRSQFDSNSNARIFCDEGTVRVMMGIPDERFVTSSDAAGDLAGFYSLLENRQVKYVVIAEQPGSTAWNLFPQFQSAPLFRPLFHASAGFLPTEIWIYEVSEARP